MATKAVNDRAKKQALDKALTAMFGRLQGRPVPDRLMSVVDQLEAAETQAPRKASGSAGR